LRKAEIGEIVAFRSAKVARNCTAFAERKATKGFPQQKRSSRHSESDCYFGGRHSESAWYFDAVMLPKRNDIERDLIRKTNIADDFWGSSA
jgi:hypothetical protein